MTGVAGKNLVQPCWFSVVFSEEISSALNQAARVIAQGGVVAFPTETFYGLAVDPFQEEALERLFRLKRRSVAKPVLVLVAEEAQLVRLAAYIPTFYPPLMRKFWPGPLTLLFPALFSLSGFLTADTGRVGARISSHPLAQALVEKCGSPITATSANLSGFPAAVRAAEVRRQIPQVDFLLEFDQFLQGTPSTIIGYEDDSPVVVRSGDIPESELFSL